MNRFVLFLLTSLALEVHLKGLKEEFTWTRISYATSSHQEPEDKASTFRQQTSRSFAGSYKGGGSKRNQIVFPGSATGTSSTGDASRRDYIHENNIPMGANRWGNKLFITVPRRRNGVTSTLNFVWLNSTERHNVPLIPYPSLEINQPNTGMGGPHLFSVYRVAVDPCDRLWMVDTGLLEIPGNRTQVQPPAILIIDLHTNRIITHYAFKDSDMANGSNLANIFVDVTRASCTDAYAYIPDVGAFGLIVYSLAENDAWRLSHNYFYVEPLAGEFSIAGHQFQWNDGVFSLGLSEVMSDGFRNVYFHSMAGTHLYSVSTRILKSRQLSTRSFHGNDFKVIADRGSGSQASASDLHQDTGALFFGLVNQNALGCWNTQKSADKSNFDVVFRDDQKFIYPCDIKVAGDDLIVLSNTMPVFLYGRLNYSQINFRIWISKVEDIIGGSACADNKHNNNNNNVQAGRGGNDNSHGSYSGKISYRL